MHMLLLLIALLIFALSYAITLRYLRRPWSMRIGGVLALFWVGLIGFGWLYVGVIPVRVVANTFVAPASAHQVLGEPGRQLVLPPHTALQARYSQSASGYYSRVNLPGVLAFYRAEAQVESSAVLADHAELLVRRDGARFAVRLIPQRYGTFLQVEAQ